MFLQSAEPLLTECLDDGLASQARNTMLAARHAAGIERSPCLLSSVRLPIRSMRLLYRRQQLYVFLPSCRRRAPLPLVVTAVANLQSSTWPSDQELLLISLHKGVSHGSFRAKYAATFFKRSHSSVTSAGARLRRWI